MAKSKQVGKAPTKVTPAVTAKTIAAEMAAKEPVVEPTPEPEPQPEPVVATPEPEQQPEPEAEPDHPAELIAALRAQLGGKTVEYGKDGYMGTKPRQPEPAPRAPREPGQPRPPKVAVSEGRMAELVEEARSATALKPTGEAAVYQRVMAEAGLKAAGLARAITPEPRAEFNKLWNRIIWRGLLLELAPEIQAAVDAGEFGADAEVGQLHMVPEARRGELVAALKEGFKSRSAMMAFAAGLMDSKVAA